MCKAAFEMGANLKSKPGHPTTVALFARCLAPRSTYVNKALPPFGKDHAPASTRRSHTVSSAAPSSLRSWSIHSLLQYTPRLPALAGMAAFSILLSSLFYLLLFTISHVNATALTTAIGPNERLCFYADVDKAGEKIGVSLRVKLRLWLLNKLPPVLLCSMFQLSHISLRYFALMLKCNSPGAIRRLLRYRL